MFLSVGASDGNPNPVKFAFLAGIGGKGVVPGRPQDSFGVGIARTQFSGAFIPFLRENLNLGLDHEDALEMYYNLAITGWLSATADLQVIDNSWVGVPMTKIIVEFEESLRKYPPIKAGTPESYVPPKK